MERMSRTRGNGIPGSWALLVLAAGLTAGAGVMLAEALANYHSTKPATVLDVINGKVADKHVTLHGTLAVDQTLMQGGQGDSQHVKAFYIPLVDGMNAVFVRLEADPQNKPISPNGDEFTGMVRTIDSDLRDDIKSAGPPTGHIAVDDHYYLNAGENPANPLIWWPLVIAGTVISLILLATIVMRYVVFRPAPIDSPMTKISDLAARPPTAATPQAPMPVLASGIFIFSTNPKVKRRFLAVRAIPTEMASGDKGLATQLDASVSFHGAVTKNLNGMWSIPFQKGTINSMRPGQQYIGARPFAAVRFGYTDPTTSKSRTITVAFQNETDRDNYRRQLS
jgi:hypothetical protein